AGLVDRFRSPAGRHVLRVYGKGNLWDMDSLAQFVRQVRSVDGHITGHPLQAYEASHEMYESYQQAALYALVAIFALLYLDFQNVRHSLLAMLPVSLGLLQLFGLLGALGQPLNPANMIVLPLILGIGVDNGVHVLHGYRRRE